jgi:xylulokinase
VNYVATDYEPQDSGAVGAALLIALGMKIIDSQEAAGNLIPVKAVYRPVPANKAVYERNYRVFRSLYKSNAKHFKALNRKC